MKKDQIDVSQSSTEEKKSAKKTDSKKSAKAVKKPSKIKKFFKDLKSEVKKIVWPTKKQVVNNTGVVLVAMAITALFIGGVDLGLKSLLDLILKR